MEFFQNSEATANQLLETFSDIPPATLYRYLRKMTADGVLKIVKQTQVRGATQKTYALAIDREKGMSDLLKVSSGEAYMQAFVEYILSFAEQFHKYSQRENIDISKGESGFSLVPLYLSDNELEAFLNSYSHIIEQFRDNKSAQSRKLRSVGLIISPPDIY